MKKSIKSNHFMCLIFLNFFRKLVEKVVRLRVANVDKTSKIGFCDYRLNTSTCSQ